VVGNTPVGNKEAGTGSKQAPLTPAVRLVTGRYYPAWAKERLRAEGYILDDAPPEPSNPANG
jgi:hypothetical protein